MESKWYNINKCLINLEGINRIECIPVLYRDRGWEINFYRNEVLVYNIKFNTKTEALSELTKLESFLIQDNEIL